MKRKVYVVLLVCCPVLVWAGDDPYSVSVNGTTNQQMCINLASENCVNTICMNSSDRNCIPKCQKMSVEKCK